MSEQRPCRHELMEWINIVSFAVDDVKLFLDTHPCNTEALEYFEEFKRITKAEKDFYSRRLFFSSIFLE